MPKHILRHLGTHNFLPVMRCLRRFQKSVKQESYEVGNTPCEIVHGNSIYLSGVIIFNVSMNRGDYSMSKNKDQLRVYGKGKYEDESIAFGADPETVLYDYDQYKKFIRGCEHAVRKDDRYNVYVTELKKSGMDKCAFLGNITEDSKVKLEMHHGPIFNLFDICDIVTKALLNRKTYRDLTTFDVANQVLEEHRLGNIMVVMLSKTVHKGNHNKRGSRSIFVNIKATVGRIDRFIDRWYDGFEKEHWEMIDHYLSELKKAGPDSVDNGLMETGEKLLRFK